MTQTPPIGRFERRERAGGIVRVSVIGLGYVGAVSSVCLARDGHHVLGCDIDAKKLELLRNGKTPVVEAGMAELVRDVVQSGRLTVTERLEDAVRQSEITFVCVGTPTDRNGTQNLDALLRVISQMGSVLAQIERYHHCVIRSTVLPGTLESLVRPLMERLSGKTVGRDFGLGFQPEFLREGSSVRDFDNPPFTVVGTFDEPSASALETLFGQLPGEFVRCSVAEAEMLKYACNAFHALKVTFANEMGRLCQASGVDARTVMSLLCRDTVLNVSSAYLRPGFAFGGSCLPKDLRSLLHLARMKSVEVPALAGVLPSNALQIDHAFNQVLDTGSRSVGLLGLSFKGGTDDLRESPLVTLAERLIGKGFDLRIHDPTVNLSLLIGANRAYIDRTIPHIASLLATDPLEVVRTSDVLVIGLAEGTMVDVVVQHAREEQTVIDLVGLRDASRLRARYRGVCW